MCNGFFIFTVANENGLVLRSKIGMVLFYVVSATYEIFIIYIYF